MVSVCSRAASGRAVLAVGHGEREAIEMFNVDIRGRHAAGHLGRLRDRARADRPEFRARPARRRLHHDQFPCRAAAARMRRTKMKQRREEWRSLGMGTLHGKWQKVPGSEAAGANGVELLERRQDDLHGGLGQPVVRALVARREKGEAATRCRSVLEIDNIHWARRRQNADRGRAGAMPLDRGQDRSGYAQGERGAESRRRARLRCGTVAAEVGKTWWIGSYIGDRIEIVPAP